MLRPLLFLYLSVNAITRSKRLTFGYQQTNILSSTTLFQASNQPTNPPTHLCSEQHCLRKEGTGSGDMLTHFQVLRLIHAALYK